MDSALTNMIVLLLAGGIVLAIFGMAIFTVIWNSKKNQMAVGITRQRQEEMLSLAQQSLDIHRENRDLLREIRDLLRDGTR